MLAPDHELTKVLNMQFLRISLGREAIMGDIETKGILAGLGIRMSDLVLTSLVLVMTCGSWRPAG